MTKNGVVDQMCAEVAQRRRTTLDRHAAYLALARAILSDEPSARPSRRAAERYHASIGQSQAAA